MYRQMTDGLPDELQCVLALIAKGTACHLSGRKTNRKSVKITDIPTAIRTPTRKEGR